MADELEGLMEQAQLRRDALIGMAERDAAGPRITRMEYSIVHGSWFWTITVYDGHPIETMGTAKRYASARRASRRQLRRIRRRWERASKERSKARKST